MRGDTAAWCAQGEISFTVIYQQWYGGPEIVLLRL